MDYQNFYTFVYANSNLWPEKIVFAVAMVGNDKITFMMTLWLSISIFR